MILNYYNDLVYHPSELFLNKDFGQVASVLGRLYGRCVTHLICCKEPNKDLRIFAGNEVVQMKKWPAILPTKLDFIKNTSVYRFLLRRRGTYKALVMFPFCPPSDLIVAKLFKVLNPGSRIILKLDANLNHLNNLNESYRAAPNSKLRQHYYYRQLLEIADVVICETQRVHQLLTQEAFLGLKSSAKFINIFNGLSDFQVSAIIGAPSSLASRNNLIIYSGRVSSPQKNVELIFKSNPVPKGWRIKFIGGFDDAFKKVIQKYQQSDPNFDDKYEFVGEITDKQTYFGELSSGRILVLSSVWEGFPMVYAEAHYFGLYIVTTDVSGASEATDNGRLGMIVPRNDPVALREALYTACSNIEKKEIVPAACEYRNRFVWEKSLRSKVFDDIFLLQ